MLTLQSQNRILCPYPHPHPGSTEAWLLPDKASEGRGTCALPTHALFPHHSFLCYPLMVDPHSNTTANGRAPCAPSQPRNVSLKNSHLEMEFLRRFLDAFQRNPSNMYIHTFTFQHSNNDFLSFFSPGTRFNQYSGDNFLDLRASTKEWSTQVISTGPGKVVERS